MIFWFRVKMIMITILLGLEKIDFTFTFYRIRPTLIGFDFLKPQIDTTHS